MPLLDTVEKLEKINLPSSQKLDAEGNPTVPESEWAWVVMDISPSKAGDISGVGRDMRDAEIGIAMITERIKEWNYHDAQEQLIPITIDTVKNLHMDDFKLLQAKVYGGQPEGGLTIDEKKDLNPTSPQHVTANNQPTHPPESI